MKAAKVIGRVVCTRKYETLEGKRLLLLQPLTWEKELNGDPFVAVDTCGAGFEEFVFYVASRDAAVAFSDAPPVDAAVVGIMDGVNLQAWTMPEGTPLKSAKKISEKKD
jgi:ethanolamine utilization protein EutN